VRDRRLPKSSGVGARLLLGRGRAEHAVGAKADYRVQLETVLALGGHTVAGFEEADAGDRCAAADLVPRGGRLPACGDQSSPCAFHEAPMLGTCPAHASTGGKLNRELVLRFGVNSDQDHVAVLLQLHLDQTSIDAVGRPLRAPSPRGPGGQSPRGTKLTERADTRLPWVIANPAGEGVGKGLHVPAWTAACANGRAARALRCDHRCGAPNGDHAAGKARAEDGCSTHAQSILDRRPQMT